MQPFKPASQNAKSPKDLEEASERRSEPADATDPAEVKKRMTVTERDADLMNRWRERQGSLANAELEDGQLDSGYRRNVVRLSRGVSLARIPRQLSASFRRKQIYSVTSEVYRIVLCLIGSLLQKSSPAPHELSPSPHSRFVHQSRKVCV